MTTTRAPSPFELGHAFHIRVSGASHAASIGVQIEGCPAGIRVSRDDIQRELDKRRPGQSILTTQRREPDHVIIESGISNAEDSARSVTTGETIHMRIDNKDAMSSHYDSIKDTPRPGHADFTARAKYGETVDLRGGGAFSGRMTACFVMAGTVAKAILAQTNPQQPIETLAFATQIGTVTVDRVVSDDEIRANTFAPGNLVHTAALEKAQAMADEVNKARREGDSVGGVIEGRIVGLPPGLGEPMFESIESRLSQALFGIPAVKGVEFGSGFAGSARRGSENNDGFEWKTDSTTGEKKVVTLTNNSGGILGGLTTGMPVVFRVALKPTSSIFKPQHTVNLATGENAELRLTGRHDPCIAIRAVPVVEHVAAIVAADILLASNTLHNPQTPIPKISNRLPS